ncbi:unnamed protein product [Microthlaspi erraticum]|uniref:Uncharacterized protein n=1 Tax=Microthlaspi erraticum TaxID=1685480 RepID=A0A6D2IMJ7_9BRAS|nr:unnamed protein product [Microthlaspi erraticum]
MKERSVTEETGRSEKTRSQRRRSLGKKTRNTIAAALIQRSISSSSSCHGVSCTSSIVSPLRCNLDKLSSRNSLRRLLYTREHSFPNPPATIRRAIAFRSPTVLDGNASITIL